MSDVLWALFEVAVNFFQGFILVYFAMISWEIRTTRSFFRVTAYCTA